jgi:hypothetical protein
MLTTIMAECEMGVRVRHRGDHSVLFHHKFMLAIGFKWMNNIIRAAFEARYARVGVGRRSLGRLAIVGPSRMGYGSIVSFFPHNIVSFII